MQSPRPQLASSAQAEERNPWLVLIVICTAVFMLLLDTTIVNNAQVKIREGLDANLTADSVGARLLHPDLRRAAALVRAAGRHFRPQAALRARDVDLHGRIAALRGIGLAG